MRSNCHIRAWGRFVRGDAEWLAFRRTKYNKMAGHAAAWYWLPLKPIGIVLQWLGTFITVVGWVLRWGLWYHVIWVKHNGEWWEYAPPAPKIERVLPPVIFEGKEKRVNR